MYRILVVDVDAEKLAQSRRLLEQHGFAVLTATGGHSAMGQLYGASIDLVVTEVALPDFDGYDLANYIGLVRSDLPIVAFTDKHNLIEGIFDQVLHKSTSDRALLQCLARLLSRARIPAAEVDVLSQSSAQKGPSSH